MLLYDDNKGKAQKAQVGTAMKNQFLHGPEWSNAIGSYFTGDPYYEGGFGTRRTPEEREEANLLTRNKRMAELSRSSDNPTPQWSGTVGRIPRFNRTEESDAIVTTRPAWVTDDYQFPASDTMRGTDRTGLSISAKDARYNREIDSLSQMPLDSISMPQLAEEVRRDSIPTMQRDSIPGVQMPEKSMDSIPSAVDTRGSDKPQGAGKTAPDVVVEPSGPSKSKDSKKTDSISTEGYNTKGVDGAVVIKILGNDKYDKKLKQEMIDVARWQTRHKKTGASGDYLGAIDGMWGQGTQDAYDAVKSREKAKNTAAITVDDVQAPVEEIEIDGDPVGESMETSPERSNMYYRRKRRIQRMDDRYARQELDLDRKENRDMRRADRADRMDEYRENIGRFEDGGILYQGAMPYQKTHNNVPVKPLTPNRKDNKGGLLY